jgi:hypothetical protein
VSREEAKIAKNEGAAKGFAPLRDPIIVMEPDEPIGKAIPDAAFKVHSVLGPVFRNQTALKASLTSVTLRELRGPRATHK